MELDRREQECPMVYQKPCNEIVANLCIYGQYGHTFGGPAHLYICANAYVRFHNGTPSGHIPT